MKRFVLGIIVYVIIVLMLWNALGLLKLYTHRYEKKVNGAEIYYAIVSSETKRKVKRIVLGDSVGCQLYPSNQEYDSVVSMSCNQAITMAGHYFLLKKFIETNQENLPEEAILLITPFSLSNDVDKYAYHYFLKPFSPVVYSKFYTEHLTRRIHSIPFYWTANLPTIKTSNYSPQWAIPASQSIKSISPLSYEYLLKMDSIASANGIEFRMISTPVRDDREDEIDSFWVDLNPDYWRQLYQLLQPYKESVQFMPADRYYDPVHFHNGQIPMDYLNLLGE